MKLMNKRLCTSSKFINGSKPFTMIFQSCSPSSVPVHNGTPPASPCSQVWTRDAILIDTSDIFSMNMTRIPKSLLCPLLSGSTASLFNIRNFSLEFWLHVCLDNHSILNPCYATWHRHVRFTLHSATPHSGSDPRIQV